MDGRSVRAYSLMDTMCCAANPALPADTEIRTGDDFKDFWKTFYNPEPEESRLTAHIRNSSVVCTWRLICFSQDH